MPVDTTREDYKDILPQWERLRDCFDGRDAVLKAGNKYVPDLPGADVSANESYRHRGNFFNATKRTTQGMVGGIFQEPPEVAFPAQFESYLEDITMTNVPFEAFALEAGQETMLMGRYGVLVDFPPAAKENEPAAEQRPYCVGYRAVDIINWRTARRGGDEELIMVVLREKAEVPDEKDNFKADCVEQYRVVELKPEGATTQLWREATDKSKGFVPFGPESPLVKAGKPLDFIPFVFLGATKPTPDLEQPPLIDLADVNLGHWRNSVDHEHGLHLVALPTPWVAGSKGAKDGPMKIGPSVVWDLDVNGSAGMLEFNGTGLGSLVTAMDEKKKQMAILGARLLEDQATADRETAAAVRLRHSGEHASLRAVAGAVELGLTLVLQIVAWWSGAPGATPSDVDVNVELNKEFTNVKADATEVQTALTALQAGEISFATWWNLITTGGWGREGIDAEAERKAIAEDKALAPEPAVDPNLSTPDPNAAPPAPKKKTVTDAAGNVKYVIAEG